MPEMKTKVLDIKTSGAKKNIDGLTKSFTPLKQQIKELTLQMQNLEKGTEEYNKVAVQLANLKQKQVEINEKVKFSNKDFGATMSNLTTISSGLVGGFNALSASMALIGGNSEDMQKALVPIQLLMASIQGFSAMDNALKALSGLKNAFEGMSSSTEIVAETTKELVKEEASAATTTATLTTATIANTKAQKAGTVASKGFATGIKGVAKAMKAFISSNPILLAIVAAIGAVSAAISALNKHFDEAGRVAKEEADILTDVNNQYKDQTVRLNVLLNTARDHNQNLQERKKAVEELNKIVPQYNGHINETTGILEANNQAVETYISNLKEKLKLEAYEGKIKEYLEKQVELEKEINDIETTGWWFTKTRIASRRQEITKIENDIKRLYNNINNLDLSKALNDNKVVSNTSSSSTKQIKLITDALKEAKKQAIDFWNIFFDTREIERKARGPQSLFIEFRDNILKQITNEKFIDTIKGSVYSFKDIFTKEFESVFNNGKQSDYFDKFVSGFTSSDIFKQPDMLNDVKELSSKYAIEIDNIVKKYNELSKTQGGKLTPAQTKQFEEEKKQYELQYNNLQEIKNAYEEIVDATFEYTKAIRELQEEELKEQIELVKTNRQLDIENKYREELRGGNNLADINRTIATEENEFDVLKQTNRILHDRLEIMKLNSNNNKLFAEEVKKLNEEIKENERQLAETEKSIDDDKYERRTKQLEVYKQELEKFYSSYSSDLENDRILKGGGTADYNLSVDLLNEQRANLDRVKQEIDRMYEQGEIDFQEHQNRMLALQQEYDSLEIEMTKAKVDRKLAIHNAYFNTLQSLSSNIGNILSEEMDKYDENSEQYRKLAVAKGWIDTLGGSLSAFMSGFQSGIPFPYNLAVAAALAGTTMTTGIMQINKIKNGSQSGGSLTSGAVSVGTYETTAYTQQAELFNGIKDQRVFVVEHDISEAQKKVKTIENNSRF